MSEYDEGGNEWVSSIIWIIVIAFFWWVFKDAGKYEGQTAKEWFNDYDYEADRHQELRDCVENYAYSEEYDDLTEIQYCL